MSWPKLPRLNPCLPCMIGNPMDNPRRSGPWVVWHKDSCARVRNGKDQEKTLLDAGYSRVASLKNHQEADDLADAQYGGRTNPRKGFVHFVEKDAGIFVAKVGACTAVARFQAKAMKHAGHGHSYVVEVDGTFIGVVPELTNAESLVAVYMKNKGRLGKCIANPTSFAELVYGDAATNPMLLVLNPYEYNFVAKVEGIIRRKLSADERLQLEQARKEYRTFHGRDPDSFVPVEVPKGTPRFVNLVGDVDRIDYTVRANSERKGKWTHKAGDHGQTSKGTKPALLVSVPGKKAPPVFAQRKGSEMYFKPTHGIMG